MKPEPIKVKVSVDAAVEPICAASSDEENAIVSAESANGLLRLVLTNKSPAAPILFVIDIRSSTVYKSYSSNGFGSGAVGVDEVNMLEFGLPPLNEARLTLSPKEYSRVKKTKILSIAGIAAALLALILALFIKNRKSRGK